MTTTISASATVRVRGFNSPAAASAVASILGEALGSALRATSSFDAKRKSQVAAAKSKR